MSTTPRLSPFDAVYSALLGTLLTWAVTAAGAGVVYLALPSKRLLDTALGFAAGVMLAASYWSLLAPALEMAEASGDYGEVGRRKDGREREREREREKTKRSVNGPLTIDRYL
jgi:zinc transporter 11